MRRIASRRDGRRWRSCARRTSGSAICRHIPIEGHPTIEGAGHFLQEDRGERLAEVMVELMTGNRREARGGEGPDRAGQRMSVTEPKLRPRLELTPTERGVRLFAWVGLIVELLILAAYWSELPERVPRHFGLTGEADAWGGRGWLLPPPVVSLGLLLLLGWLERFPHRFNYPWRITEENARRQYRLARELLEWLAAISAWFFAAISLEQCHVALEGAALLGGWLVPAGLGALFLALGIYLVRARRAL